MTQLTEAYMHRPASMSWKDDGCDINVDIVVDGDGDGDGGNGDGGNDDANGDGDADTVVMVMMLVILFFLSSRKLFWPLCHVMSLVSI